MSSIMEEQILEEQVLLSSRRGTMMKHLLMNMVRRTTNNLIKALRWHAEC